MDADAEVIERARAGESLAWEKLVVRHSKRIYNYCYRFVGRADYAEDLTQEVFVKIFRNLGNFKPESGHFVTWMMSVTRNLLIDHYRQSKGDRLTVSTDENEEFSVLDVMPDSGPSPQTAVEQKEKAAFVRQGLQHLSPDLREAVILRDLQELSYQEIGDILKIPEGTVKSRINRGRVELAKHLQRMGSLGKGMAF
ncbi:MAG: RNA polymerase sigma factor [Acidobacteriota bacterium]